MLNCNYLNLLCNIIYTNNDILLIFRRWVDRSNEVETPFFKRFNAKLRVKWHFIRSCRMTHALVLVTMLNITLAILMKCRPIITCSKNLLSSPLSSKMSTTRFSMTSMENIKDILLRNAPTHDIINSSVEEKTIDPSVLPTKTD